MSRLTDTFITMNLHEECLLKFLLNPSDLFQTTELLKLNNTLIAKGNFAQSILAKTPKINYTTNRL